MALTAEDVAEIERTLEAPAVPEFAALRRQFPKISWARCDAADVTEAPFRSLPGFDLHLINASNACVQITADPGEATGFLLAMRTPPR